nr:hypothetical protein [uncultured bacterium]
MHSMNNHKVVYLLLVSVVSMLIAFTLSILIRYLKSPAAIIIISGPVLIPLLLIFFQFPIRHISFDLISIFLLFWIYLLAFMSPMYLYAKTKKKMLIRVQIGLIVVHGIFCPFLIWVMSMM